MPGNLDLRSQQKPSLDGDLGKIGHKWLAAEAQQA
jgi:hypothetical protein